MPTVSLSPLFNGVQNFSAGGIPLSGGLLYTYLAGTTTPSPTYTDSTGATPNANPIVLDASGRPSSEIWILSSAYKFVLMDSLSNVIATYDNITSSYAYQPSGTGAVPTTVQAKLSESVSVKDFGAVGDGVTDDTGAINLAVAAVGEGGELRFPKSTYKFGALSAISKPIIIDLGGSRIIPVSGILFDINIPVPFNYASSVIIRNGYVYGGTIANIVKVTNCQSVTIENLNALGTTFTHSAFWNLTGFGLTIRRCKIRGCAGPAAIYLSLSADSTQYSNAIDIDDCEISTFTNGQGILIEGGFPIKIAGNTFQYIQAGAIRHLDSRYAVCNLESNYFEGNYAYDIKLGAFGGAYAINKNHFGPVANAWLTATAYIVGDVVYTLGNTYTCAINNTSGVFATDLAAGKWTLQTLKAEDRILMASSSRVEASSNYITSKVGGFGAVAPMSFVGTNNVAADTATGYTGTWDRELSDAIRGKSPKLLHNKKYGLAELTVAANTAAYIAQAVPLTNYGFDEWLIVGTYDFNAGIREIFRVFVNAFLAAGPITHIFGNVITDLQVNETLTLNVAPATAWSPGDTVTGGSSGAVCTIVGQRSATTYWIKDRTKNFTAAETLSNGTYAASQFGAFPTTTTASGVPHSYVSVQDVTNSTYHIIVSNTGTIAMKYETVYIGNHRVT